MNQPSDLRFGTSREGHVRQLMADAAGVIAAFATRVNLQKQLRPAEREEFRRRLAGVVADCESIRVWLGAGAPR